MASEIKFRFELNDKPNREGLHEIFLVINDGKKQKIKTEVQVKNDHFGVFKDVLTVKGKKVFKRVLTAGKWVTNKDRDAAYKNNKLQAKLDEFKKVYDKKKAEDFIIDRETLIKEVNNKYVLKDVITVWDRKIDELKDDYANRKGYITTKNHLLAFLEEEKQSSKIDFRQVDKAFLTRWEKWLFKNINGGNCSDASVHTQMQRLCAIFNYAIKEEIITPDIYPFKKYKLPTVTKKYKERLTVEEIKAFENAYTKKGSLSFHVQNAFLFAIRTAGMRVEDVLTLRVKAIVHNRINYNMSKRGTKGKFKSILITPKIQAILNHYITKDSKPDDIIFPFVDRNIHSWSEEEYLKEIGRKTSLINKYLKLIAKAAGISEKKKVTTHIARHSFASAALKQTKDIKAVQDALGHSKPEITQRYLAELNIENQDEMMLSLAI